MTSANELSALSALVAELWPGARLAGVEVLGEDAADDATGKAKGYGRPLRLEIRDAAGGSRTVVFRTVLADAFGHERRADRAAGTLLANDTFGLVPDHVPALDVGAIREGGALVSLRGCGELYLVTGFAEGTLYADELRNVAATGEAGAGDVGRCDRLARWLADLHRRDPAGRPPPSPEVGGVDAGARWRRAVRDLVGHGEGIFGVVDGYADDVPGAPAARLEEIERRCVAYRWRLRRRSARLARTHGDFHPFNIVFRGDRPAFLDASRGCEGEPADDVTALAVNYVFFAIDRPGSWPRGLGVLWRRFWATYLERSGDPELLEAAPPFFAWRALVVCCPRFYPHLSAAGRDAVLGLATRALDAGRLDPAWAEELFR